MAETETNRLVIRTRGLTRTYKLGSQKVHALRGIDLDVRQNEYVAVMGHSGSGKSTLMNMLGCLDIADAGEYELNGIMTTHMNCCHDCQPRKTSNCHLSIPTSLSGKGVNWLVSRLSGSAWQIVSIINPTNSAAAKNSA